MKPQNPWLGLKSYDENDHLYGRQKESDELSNIIINSFHTIIYGKSGIGKTSLLRAGVFPTLRYEDFMPIYIRLEHKENAEEDYYLRQIEEVVGGADDTCGETHGCASLQDIHGASLHTIFSSIKSIKSRGIGLTPVFVFDQFEEIFTLNENHSSEAVTRFFSDLSDILNNDDTTQNYRIVICLREDYLYYIESLSESIPAFKRNRYRLLDLSRDEALEVITQPQKDLVTTAVADEILRKLSPDNANEVNATILSLYMSQLYDKMVKSSATTITSSLIRQFGDDIISTFYFSSIEGISDHSIEYLEDHLVTTGGYRHNVPLEDAISDGVKQQEIDRLKDLRILNIQPRQGNVLYMEYTHDVLCPIIVSNREQRTLRKKAKRQRKLITAWVTSVLILLAIVGSMVALILQISKKQEAMMLMQSRAIAGQAVQLFEKGEYAKGVALCLKALPEDLSNPDRPVSYDAIQRLYSFMYSDFANCQYVLHHDNPVECAEYSPDSRLILTLSDGIIRLWDASDFKLLRKINVQTDDFWYACFSPDGKRIIATSSETTKIWETATGKEIPLFKGKQCPTGFVTYSPDGRYLVSSVDTTLVVWNALTGKRVKEMEKTSGCLNHASFSPDGKYLIADYNPYEENKVPGVVLWNVATGKQVRFIKVPNEVSYAKFSPDGQLFSVNTSDGYLYVWDFKTGVLKSEIEASNDAIVTHSYSPDGHYIVTASIDSTAKIWNVHTGELVKVVRGHSESVRRALFSSDGQSMLISSMDGNVMTWSLKYSGQTAKSENLVFSFSQNSFTPDGKCMTLYSPSDHSLVNYDIATGKAVSTIVSDIPVVASASAYSPDGKYFANYSDLILSEDNNGDSIVRIRNINGKIVSTLQIHNAIIISASFSPDSKQVVTSSSDSVARIWDLATGKLIKTFTGHEDCLTSACFSPDGERIVTSSIDNTAIIWDAKTGGKLKVLQWHTMPLSSAQFSPDGKYIATSSMDNNVILWDAVSGKQLRTLRRPKAFFFSIAFSPDSRHIVATSAKENLVMVFDVSTGVQMISLNCMLPVNAAFSPDGKYIVAYSLFPMTSGQEFGGCTKTWRFYSPQEIINHFRRVVGNYTFTPYEEIKYYLR